MQFQYIMRHDIFSYFLKVVIKVIWFDIVDRKNHMVLIDLQFSFFWGILNKIYVLIHIPIYNYQLHYNMYWFSWKYFTIYFQVSFVIPQDVIHGRIILLVTLILILTDIFINVTSKSPNTKSVTSISAWILTCIHFVFGALLEYGCILFYKYVSIFRDDNDKKYLKQFDLLALMSSVMSFITFNIVFWNIQPF